LDILKRSGQTTLTLAIESGNINIRKKMGKSFSDDKILEVISLALNKDIRHFKLYFMAGLPEEIDCAENIIALIKKVRNILMPYAKEKKIMPSLDADLSLFVPKPKTIWGNEKLSDSAYYKNVVKELKRNLFKLGCNVKFDEPRHSVIQYVLSRAKEDLCDKICKIIKEGGSINKAVSDYLKLL
jgi:radical SAM superfamily enzyme YgiQ (UPF0313 family)